MYVTLTGHHSPAAATSSFWPRYPTLSDLYTIAWWKEPCRGCQY